MSLFEAAIRLAHLRNSVKERSGERVSSNYRAEVDYPAILGVGRVDRGTWITARRSADSRVTMLA